MTDDERNALVERLRIEQTLRDELKAKPEEPKPKPWWESNLALLLIGAVISSLLVPWLQYTEKNFEWKRQNRFENTNYRLERMRECLTEFIVLWAFNGEAYERARPLLARDTLTEKEQADFEVQFIDLQNRRFLQNAKVVSLMIHFRDTTGLRDKFQQYLVGSSDYFREVEAAVHRSSSSGSAAAGEAAAEGELNAQLVRLNEIYTAIANKMIEEIGTSEDENEKYRL